ncbi:MAG TPA: TolC family protein [Vicinamibacterales bacterium]|jgi:outer membrane protein TolC|nr:TolC family protein [Vicinamibacterales bacterium]
MLRPILLAVVLFGLCRPDPAAAQDSAAPMFLTLDQALQYAADHYPTVRAALEQVNASAAGVNLAKTAYLPRLDSIWQSHLATTNNVFGQVLPQSVIPALSGPVLPTASGKGVWGSATGALASWEPFDFGLRDAAVAGAEAAVTRARAGVVLTRLEVQAAVGAAFLDLAAAQEAMKVAQADVDRRNVLIRSVQTLVDNQLRPGADASRAAAEGAAAQTRVLLAQRAELVAQATLRHLLGGTAGPLTTDARVVIGRLPPADVQTTAAEMHPLALLRHAAVTAAEAQQQVLARTDYPHVFVQSSVSARGSGASADGTMSTNPNGLGLERVNWAAGIQIVFPNLFDFANLRARKAAAAATTRAESALYDEALLSVSAQQQAALATVQTARAIAANTPVQLGAARQSEAQTRARYDAGLATLNELAEAQSLLTQAEVQDQMARVEVWRALLSQAVANDSLPSFLTLLRP